MKLDLMYPSYNIRHNEERNNTMTEKSEELRLRYLYRRLIIEGKIALSFESAMKIIGPDCAYHLYSVPIMKRVIKKRESLGKVSCISVTGGRFSGRHYRSSRFS